MHMPSPTPPSSPSWEELQSRNQELTDLNQQLQAAAQAMSRLLETARHDLRQPLQIIVSIQEALAKTHHGDKETKLVAHLGVAAESMSAILNALPGITLPADSYRGAAPVDDASNATAQGPSPDCAGASGRGAVFLVDDDTLVREVLRALLEDAGFHVEDYTTCEAFLAAYVPGSDGCLLVDAYLPGMNGFELLQRLKEMGDGLPSIMITGNSGVPMAIQAMRAGVVDLIEKPVGGDELIASVERALEQSRDASKMLAWRETATGHMAHLTSRQREIMDLVLAGHPSKNIAADLRISQRTVENHRAAIMKRTGTKSLPALARLALAAAWNSEENYGHGWRATS